MVVGKGMELATDETSAIQHQGEASFDESILRAQRHWR